MTHWNKKLHVSSDFKLDIGYGWLLGNKFNENPFGEGDDGDNDDDMCILESLNYEQSCGLLKSNLLLHIGI